MTIRLKGIDFKFIHLPDATPEEAQRYIDFLHGKGITDITDITVKDCGNDEVDISYTCKHERFERIRRITGYLVGDITSWNDAKQAEEHDRVKHD